MSLMKDLARPRRFIMMRKIFLCLALLLLVSSVRAIVPEEEATISTLGKTSPVMEETLPRLDKVMAAIIQVESKGNPRAFNKSGNCAGILQITPVLVRQCNIWLKQKKSKKRYSLQDRFSKEKSVEMFYMIQDYYNPKHDIEKAIRLWNGGPNYTKRGTQRYYNKVIRHLK